MKINLTILATLILLCAAAHGQTTYYYQYPNPIRMVREKLNEECGRAHVKTCYYFWGEEDSYIDTITFSEQGLPVLERSRSKSIHYSYVGDTSYMRTYAKTWSKPYVVSTLEKPDKRGKMNFKYTGQLDPLDSLKIPQISEWISYDKYGSLTEEHRVGGGKYRNVYKENRLSDIYYTAFTYEAKEFLFEHLYYDSTGMLSGFDTFNNGKKTSTQFTYDLLGRINHTTISNENNNDQITYTYNEAGNLTEAKTVTLSGETSYMKYQYYENGLLNTKTEIEGDKERVWATYIYYYY